MVAALRSNGAESAVAAPPNMEGLPVTLEENLFEWKSSENTMYAGMTRNQPDPDWPG
jgi:hypothetical protein